MLISGTAGIDDPDLRRARRETDAALAHQLDPGGTGDVPVPVEVFLRRWMDGPLFADLDHRTAGLEERARNTGEGLASSLRLAGTGTQLPLWDQLHRLTMPVLIVCGERDSKFTALGRRMADAIGTNARVAVVPAAGHAPHLQRPDTVAQLVRVHADGTASG